MSRPMNSLLTRTQRAHNATGESAAGIWKISIPFQRHGKRAHATRGIGGETPQCNRPATSHSRSVTQAYWLTINLFRIVRRISSDRGDLLRTSGYRSQVPTAQRMATASAAGYNCRGNAGMANVLLRFQRTIAIFLLSPLINFIRVAFQDSLSPARPQRRSAWQYAA